MKKRRRPDGNSRRLSLADQMEDNPQMDEHRNNIGDGAQVTHSPKQTGPWSEFQDDISDVISDSIDYGWGANDGARAVVRWLNENGLHGAEAAAIKAERDELLECLAAVVAIADRETEPFIRARAALSKARPSNRGEA